jgi:hypothetical protein
MHARRVLQGDGLAARKANGAILCLDLDVVLRHARQFDQRDEIVSLLKVVDSGNVPMPAVEPRSHSLSKLLSSARCRLKRA